MADKVAILLNKLTLHICKMEDSVRHLFELNQAYCEFNATLQSIFGPPPNPNLCRQF